MTIFVTDPCPIKSAQSQCDKHVVKMVLESAQMLSTAWRIWDADWSENHELYKSAYAKHPCTVWVQQATENYTWLYDHFSALSDEYTHRYSKHHASSRLLDALANVPEYHTHTRTNFALAMPEEYKSDCAYTSYRNYLVNEKQSFARWVKDPSRKPIWWENHGLN